MDTGAATPTPAIPAVRLPAPPPRSTPSLRLDPAAYLAERNIPDNTARTVAGAVGWTLSIAKDWAPAGGHGPIGPWSSCRSSRPSRDRRHRRSGTSRTDGDKARRPRDLAYLWYWSMAGRGPGPDCARPPQQPDGSVARVDRLCPDKPGRLPTRGGFPVVAQEPDDRPIRRVVMRRASRRGGGLSSLLRLVFGVPGCGRLGGALAGVRLLA